MSAREGTNIQLLLDQIAQLSLVEQKLLLNMASAQHLLDSSKSDNTRDVSMWSVAVYQAFCGAVGGAAATGIGPQPFRKLLGGSAAWAPVAAFMSVGALSSLTVTDRQAVYILLADLLVSQARQLARYANAPFTAKFIANCTANISGLFDVAFPGYLEANMVHVVARQIHHHKAQE